MKCLFHCGSRRHAGGERVLLCLTGMFRMSAVSPERASHTRFVRNVRVVDAAMSWNGKIGGSLPALVGDASAG